MATRIRSPISPMSGHLPATRAPEIRTGSWLAPEAPANPHSLAGFVARRALAAFAIAVSLAPLDTFGARHARSHVALPQSRPAPARQLPYPQLEMPLQISGTQYAPVAWSDIAGWSEDAHLAAYKAFRVSCKPISAQTQPPTEAKALGASLRDPCRIAKGPEL